MQRSEAFKQPLVARLVMRNALVQAAGRGATVLLALGALMILTRSLGVEGVGDYILVTSLLALLNFSDMGLYMITVRELAAGDDEPEGLMGNVLLLRIGTAVASMALLLTVTVLLGYSSEVTAAVAVGSVSFLFIAVGSGSLGAVFLANLRMEYQVLAAVVQSIVFLSLVGVVVAFDKGLVALILAYDAGALANALVVIAFSRRFVVPRLSLNTGVCGRIMAASLPAGINSIAWILYTRVDMVMLSKMKDAEAVGLYGLAYRFVDLAWPLGFFMVGSVYPLISQRYRSGDHQGLNRLLQRSTDVLSVLVIALATVFIVFAEPIIRVVASGEFVPAASALRILSLAIALMWIGILATNTLLALGRQMALLWIGLAGLTLKVGLNLVLIPRFDYDGAAVATVATEFVGAVVMLSIIARHLGHMMSFQVAAKFVPVVLAASAVAQLLFADMVLAQAAIVLCGLLVGAALTRVISVQDIRMLLARRAPAEAGSLSWAGELESSN